jgi:hypothetical protein
MRAFLRIATPILLPIVWLSACKAGTPANSAPANQAQAPIPLTTITAASGGKIVYGSVAGVTTQPAALAKMLSMVHTNSGEKPVIGKPFQFNGTNSVGVFFTVTDHPDANLPLAGMVIATSTGPNQVQAGMIYDLASRFGQTVNPMLQQLSSVWNPGATPASGPQAEATAVSAGGSAAGVPAGMQKYTLRDNTASVSIPAGWTVDPTSGGGTMLIHGTNGETVILGNMFLAVDPSALKGPVKPLKGQIVYPSNVDPVKSFADLIQQFRKSNNMGPAPIQIQSAEQVAPPPGDAFQGERCAQATGQVNPDGKGMQGMFRVICVNPGQYGDFNFIDYVAEFPLSEASQGNAIGAAMINGYQENIALVTQLATAQAAPHIAQLKQVAAQQQAANQQFTANAINNIHAIGAAATARMNTTEAANSAEQAGWNAQQNSNAQNAAGFSNYLLDQTVVQNNSTGAHATAWNNTADALVQSNPSKYSYVSTPNYISGTDY